MSNAPGHPPCGQEEWPDIRINADLWAVSKPGRINIGRLGTRKPITEGGVDPLEQAEQLKILCVTC